VTLPIAPRSPPVRAGKRVIAVRTVGRADQPSIGSSTKTGIWRVVFFW
jgi:hypothetical protein